MRVCIMIEGQEGVTWDEWRSLASGAEEAGLDGLFRSDHYTSFHGPPGPALDAWSTLSALAAVTSRIRLGTLVSAATFRHPSVLARMAVTVDHISGGRVEVGLGTGWFDREHAQNGFPFPDMPSRFDLLAEYAEVVVRSWTEDSFDHDGRFFVLRGQSALPCPVQQPHPPLILGGRARPRSAALAAHLAAEYNVAFAPPAECRDHRARLDRACLEVGREPATLPLSLMIFAALGATRADAQQRLERAGPLFMAPLTTGLLGTVDDVAEQLGEYEKAGITRIYLQHPDRSDLDAVALMGELARTCSDTTR
jgi:alkanesulfonate monooxygenase SsuD/methylene tetrahydromethanopterin reductase-like flavin-dependent oxidoreductase (luciferase family)